jgi:hypothetical protein
VNIRFTSSLTPEDENAIAPGLLTAIANILDLLPIAYSIRIDTTDGQSYHHSGLAKTDLLSDRSSVAAKALISATK